LARSLSLHACFFLTRFSTHAHNLPQSLLDATASPYARLLALSSLLKTVTEAPLE
jgi:hypothetical protein